MLCHFEDFKIYSGLWPLLVSLGVSVCTVAEVDNLTVHNGRSNTSAKAAELAEFRKITTF